MIKLEMLLQDGLESELNLQNQLKALSETFQQQLLETEKKQKEEFEKRIHENAALPTCIDQELSVFKEANHQNKNVASTSALTSDKRTTNEQIQPERSNSSKVYSAHGNTTKTSEVKHTGTHRCERAALAITRPSKEEEAMAECLKKFSAIPVPSHATVPLFEEMMAKREKQRKQDHEHRKNFLLSIQKPFQFLEREKEKREKLMTRINEVEEEKNKAVAVQKLPKVVRDSDSRREVQRDYIQKTEQHEKSPTSQSPKCRTADRTKKEKMGFLDERPSFQPKITRKVPDFSKLHKALQTVAMKKTQTKDTTKCQPFHLRTSTLPVRQNRTSPQNSQVPNAVHLSRSKSLGALTSLSTDTLPTYITDAARKRSMAIRKSMEMQESRNQESTDWLRKYQMRSEAMKRTVMLHAKLLDPHRSLKEVYNEKLQHHREADQQRMKVYMRELRDMKARVSERPYLFEQVKQRSAKANAEKAYRNKLKSTGLKEQFVEENGKAVTRSSISSISEGNTDGSMADNGIHSREENVDDGEKIEDVKEKSVNYKGEEMP